MSIELTPTQARRLWWLLTGTKDSTTDDAVRRTCSAIIDELERRPGWSKFQFGRPLPTDGGAQEEQDG